jgi:2-oxoglutarate ferredoxin oxidoreductase subunit delta
MFASNRKPILCPAQERKYYRITVDAELCDGCRLCIEFCPLDILEVAADTNQRMLHYVVVKHPLNCLGCDQCQRICPTASIFVTEAINESGGSCEE